METLLHKFYAANISVALDGSMLVASTHERAMAWGMLFCFVAAICLVTILLFQKRGVRTAALVLFLFTLTIPVFIIPAVKHEYIHVTPKLITIDSGAWYRDSKTVMTLEDLDHIREVENGIVPSNFIGDPDVEWHFFWRNGKSAVLDLNDFFNAHRMVVAIYIEDRGYLVERLEEQAGTSF